MKNSKTKISPPQSMDNLGQDILSYCQSEEASSDNIGTIISKLEDMKRMLEEYKKHSTE